MKRILFACIASVCLGSLTARTTNKALAAFRENEVLRNAAISLKVIESGSGRSICEYLPNTALIPASTLKILTTATALELLGPDFRFETRIEKEGKILAGGKLEGNLYIRGGGDPSLGSKQLGKPDFLDNWVEAIRQAGIKALSGKVLTDESFFDNEGINPRWTWQDMGNYYAAPAYAIAYLDNSYELALRSGSVGSKPEILGTTPPLPKLSFENHLKSAAIAIDSAYIYGAPRSWQRSIYGAIPANRSRFVVKGDIPHPGQVLAAHLEAKLRAKGISVERRQLKATGSRQALYKHYSPSLSDIISRINTKSDNLYAEHVFRYLGASAQTQKSTSNAAIARLSAFWQSKGLPVEQLFMYDGSGLSPVNAVSAAFLVEVLRYMQQESKYGAAFKASLPLAGKEGTVASFLKQTSLEAKARVKSGSVERVRAYAGYIEQKGKSYIFAIIVNNANGKSAAVRKKIEELLVDLTSSAAKRE